MNNQNIKTYENGYVVLPVEVYQKLIAEHANAVNMVKRLVKLKVNYKDQVEIAFDNELLYDIAKDLYEPSAFNTPERELIPRDDLLAWTSDITKPVTEDEEPAAEG